MPNSVPTGWRATTLGGVADYHNGFAFKPHHWQERGTPIIRIGQMLNPKAEIDYAGFRVPPQNMIDTGDLLFSWSATLATCIWDRGPAYLNQHLFKVVPKENESLGFVHHLLDHVMERLGGMSHGTTMRHIKRGDLHRFSVSVPPLPAQTSIAAILDTLDDTIRQTEQVIAKLQQMKQGLLHDLLTRGIDENGEVRDPERRPELFKDSVLGRIPRGWVVGKLERWLATSPRNGLSPLPVEHRTGVMVLGLGCLTVHGFEPRQLKHVPAGGKEYERARLSDGDLLISRSNTRDLVGLAGIYSSVGGPCLYPDLMMRLTPTPSMEAIFLELTLMGKVVRRQIQAHAAGTSGSMAKISSKIVRALQVAMPSGDERQAILARVQVETQVLDQERRVLQKLRLLKQGLMDDLLTGKVRVPVEPA